MKKITLLVLALSLVGVIAFGAVSDVSAEEISPLYPGNGRGNGRSGGGTGTGIPMDMNINMDGMLDDYMAQYFADTFEIEVEVLKDRVAGGETLGEIGLSLGLDAQAIYDLQVEARTAALNQAVVDGLLTAEQAEWMLSRLDNRQAGVNAGICDGDRV